MKVKTKAKSIFKKVSAWAITAALLATTIAAGTGGFAAKAAGTDTWDGSVATGFAGGDGTQNNPYQHSLLTWRSR